MPSTRRPPAREKTQERAIWRGTISFGLVQIPVGLYRAEHDQELHFTLLDKKDLSPIHYARTNKVTGRAVPWPDIVKGYEIERGKYVIMTDDDFAAANVSATGGIDIVDFVNEASISRPYFIKPYYLLPQDRSEKTYVLLREALKKSGKVGVATIVLRTRQHLCMVCVEGDALVLELLRFPHELRPEGELSFPGKRQKSLVSDKELAMATALVASMSGPFKPASYRDQYRDDVLALIAKKAKQKGGKIEKPAAKEAPQHAVMDVMRLLQDSVRERGENKEVPKTKVAAKRVTKTTPRKKAKTTRRMG
jgi:DNA end-binding protein Ku